MQCSECKDITYNGWANYETCAVEGWLTNNEDTKEKLDDITKNAANLFEYQQADKLRRMVLHMMHDYTDNVYEFGGSIHSGLFIDLLKAAVDNVKWYAIIDHHKHDFD